MGRKRKQDPFRKREAGKYDRPVPSREFILEQLAGYGAPVSGETLTDDLKVEARDQDSLQRRLNAMQRDGQIIRNRRGDYGLINRMDLIRGRVIGHPDGYGFLVPDEGGSDLYLPPQQMRTLLHDDHVVVRLAGVDRRGRREGALVEILERGHQEIVGRFMLSGNHGYVESANRRISQNIMVPPDMRNGAEDGQIVVIALLESPNRHMPPYGKVVEVLGDHMAPGMEIDIAMRMHEIPARWPATVEQESRAFGETVQDAALEGREDLRDLPLVTIDGEDARDFDDAVFCEPRGRGWRLLVAIADVSTYVHPGTVLDAEAEARGNSVYFPERVIPMLHEVLSNGLCSLNPDVDRLCMVCELTLAATGKVSRYRFFEAVMRSHARLTYTEVAGILQGDRKLRRKYHDLVTHLEHLHDLYCQLRRQRERRGAIDFESTETRIIFGKQKKIERIVPLIRNDAHRLIEECMVAANVAAADFLLSNRITALYRVHEGPPDEKLADLREFLSELGLSLGGGDRPEPKHYAALLAAVRDRPDTHLIETVMLRSLSQAMYSPDNTGHFGLAHEAYTHFTSPIRRYPDLLVHRAIRHILHNRKAAAFGYSHARMQEIGEHCSMTDRRADEATRDAIDWLKCEYMMDKVGEEYGGIISAVTGFGLFVELADIYVEGLVHVTSLHNDYYHYDAVKHRLTGERTGVTYRLADRIRVRVVRVNLDESKIDFEPAAPPAGGVRKGSKRRGAHKTGARKRAAARTGARRRKG